jgi:hypothetical protein
VASVSVALAEPPPQDVFVVLAVAPGDSPELANDVTEALSFALSQDEGQALNFLPKERVIEQLGYASPDQPGTCIFDHECLRRVHKELGTRLFVVARLESTEERHDITVVRITESAELDVVTSARTAASTADLINRTRTLASIALRPPKIMLVISVNESEASIEVDGLPVGIGSVTLEVEPGVQQVRVSKPGFHPFEREVPCAAGAPCVLPVHLQSTQPNLVTGGAAMSTPEILQMTGWSVAGVGAVMSVVGLIYGVDATQASDDFESACRTVPCTMTRAEAQALASEGQTGATVFNSVGIPGLVLLAGGVATGVVGHWLESKDATLTVVPLSGTRSGWGVVGTLRY